MDAHWPEKLVLANLSHAPVFYSLATPQAKPPTCHSGRHPCSCLAPPAPPLAAAGWSSRNSAPMQLSPWPCGYWWLWKTALHRSNLPVKAWLSQRTATKSAVGVIPLHLPCHVHPSKPSWLTISIQFFTQQRRILVLCILLGMLTLFLPQSNPYDLHSQAVSLMSSIHAPTSSTSLDLVISTQVFAHTKQKLCFMLRPPLKAEKPLCVCE